MNTKTQKPAYQVPRTTRTVLRIDVNLCSSTTSQNMSATVENMDETDYGWEI